MSLSKTTGRERVPQKIERPQPSSKAWAQAIEALPHGIDLKKAKLGKDKQPELQRIEVLLGGLSTTPEAWKGHDKAVRREVVDLLHRMGIDLSAISTGRKPKKGPEADPKAKDGFQKELGLNWARLTDKLPFNLYYNTVNPSYVRAELRPQLDALTEQISDKSPLDLPSWPQLPEPVRHALTYRRIRFHLDPNSSSPITRDEWKAMKPEARAEVLALLQASGFGIAHFQRPGSRESHAGRQVQNVAPGMSGGEDERKFEISSAITSLSNIVTPVLSRALTQGPDKRGPGTFDFERDKIVDQAQNFLVSRYYGFEREDFADKLIAAAKRGVKVEVEMHPPETAVRQKAQTAAMERLRAAVEKDPTVKKNLSFSKATILPHDPEKQFPQIMHEKSVIADTPDGTLVELEGGINGGGNSPNNLDYAMRIEGTAVLDALRKYLAFRGKGHTNAESVAEEIIRATPRDDLEQKVVAKAKKEGVRLTKTSLGGGGQRQVPGPETYTPAELRRRAEAGLSINLSIHDVARFSHFQEKSGNPKWVLNDSLSEVLATALENKSAVTLTIPREDESIDRAHYLAIKEATTPFRKLGALVCWDDTVVRDVSYQNMIYQNLDLAIERGESCEVAAFALTDAGVMERIVNLHRKLKDLPEKDAPKVQVAVHELEIDDQQVNQKVAALTTAGVDVRVFTDKDAVHIAQKLSRDLGTRVRAEDIKLHAKGMILGREASGGKPIDPRTAHGSANFSVSGFERNVEGGRMYHQPALAEELQDRIFAEIFASCRPVDKLDFVPLSVRQSVFQKVPLDTPIEDLSFMAYDLETTGFAAHFGDVPVSMAAIRESLEKKENADGTVTWSRSKDRIGEMDARCRLGYNAFGTEQNVPRNAAEIHGLTRDKLEDAPPLKDALAKFKQLAQQSGKVAVPLCHNTKFDAPFLDLQYAKPENHVGDINQQVVDQPSICTMELAKEAIPFKHKEDRAPGEKRQSYKLTVLAEQLAGKTQSEVHDAFEDVDLALDVLVGLANKLQAKTLGDLLPKDKLYLDQPGSRFTIYQDAKGSQELARFSHESDPRVAEVHGRSMKDGSELLGSARRIYDHQVLGFEGDRVHVRLATSQGENEEAVQGWVPADQLRFYQAGTTYWGLRESGEKLQPPWQMSRGEFWRQETEHDAYEKAEKTTPDVAKSADGKKAKTGPHLSGQLSAAEAALNRAEQRADDAGDEARELTGLAEMARQFASTSKADRDDAAERVARLRKQLGQ